MIAADRNKQSGLTLVELMVSMAVGVMLITGIIQLMANNKQQYIFQSELARMQENGRYALTVIREELQMAGVAGCSATSQINNLLDSSAANYSDTLFNLNQAVGGWEYRPGSVDKTAPTNSYTLTNVVSSAPADWENGDTPSIALDSALNNKVLKGTDVFFVKRTEPALDLTITTATTFAVNAGTTFSVSADVDLGQLVVLSDCSGTDLFRNCNVDPLALSTVKRIGCVDAPNNDTSLLWGHAYEVLQGGEDATIAPVTIHGFYIGLGQDNQPTLYRKRYSQGAPSNAEPLVEGIESMQVLYGVDTDADLVPNQYVTAAGLSGGAADNVVSVRVSLLLRSIQEIEEVDNTDSLLMAETTINSGSDRYLRKAVSTTVQLRNRGI